MAPAATLALSHTSPAPTPGFWVPRLAARSLHTGHFSLAAAHALSSTRKNYTVFPCLIFPSLPLSGSLLSAQIQTELCVVLQDIPVTLRKSSRE